MAKKQTRRAVSLPRHVYIAATALAYSRGVTLAQLTTDALRAFGVVAAESYHVPVEHAQAAKEAREHGRWKVRPGSSVRLLESYERVRRDGPIRKALGDAHADALGEPHWYERRRVA